jgi:uncharacterized protein YecT (DUF1311 family)
VVREVTQAYEAVRAKLPEKEREDLKAQEAWQTYRGLNCAAEADQYEGGTIKPAIQLGCEAKLAEDRIGEIHRSTTRIN